MTHYRARAQEWPDMPGDGEDGDAIIFQPRVACPRLGPPQILVRRMAMARRQRQPRRHHRIAGQPPHAGVIGFATIAANEAGAFDIYQDVIKPGTGWLGPDDIGRRRWVVNFCDGHWLYQPILASALKADKRFEDASILRNPHQANPFKLTDEQWAAITSRRSD